ncbi:hypothetical protein BDW22DRAFT_243183 [Trametopsis cervina]|nr:hypothetical protein BDW22DRAFT_243183 [Trametopsis cervina]
MNVGIPLLTLTEWEDELDIAPGPIPTPPATPSANRFQSSTPRPSQAQRAAIARGQTPQTVLSQNTETSSPMAPVTPSARRICKESEGGVARVVLPPTPTSLQLTPSQRVKRLEAIMAGLKEANDPSPSTPSSARSSHTSRVPEREKAAQSFTAFLNRTPSSSQDNEQPARGPLPGIGRALREAQTPVAKGGSSNSAKRPISEVDDDEEAQFWQGADVQPQKIRRVDHDVAIDKGGKGKERELDPFRGSQGSDHGPVSSRLTMKYLRPQHRILTGELLRCGTVLIARCQFAGLSCR